MQFAGEMGSFLIAFFLGEIDIHRGLAGWLPVLY
jgi:hypothetical protein